MRHRPKSLSSRCCAMGHRSRRCIPTLTTDQDVAPRKRLQIFRVLQHTAVTCLFRRGSPNVGAGEKDGFNPREIVFLPHSLKENAADHASPANHPYAQHGTSEIASAYLYRAPFRIRKRKLKATGLFCWYSVIWVLRPHTTTSNCKSARYSSRQPSVLGVQPPAPGLTSQPLVRTTRFCLLNLLLRPRCASRASRLAANSPPPRLLLPR